MPDGNSALETHILYWKRWWARTIQETRQYWNAYRTSTAVAAPVISALFWFALRGWKGWSELLQSIALGFAIFSAGWAIAFFISLLRVPAILDAEKSAELENARNEISELKAAATPKRTPQQEHLLKKVHASLGVFNNQDQKLAAIEILRYLHTNGEISAGTHLLSVSRTIRVDSSLMWTILGILYKGGIVNHIPGDGRTPDKYVLPPAMHDVLNWALYDT